MELNVTFISVNIEIFLPLILTLCSLFKPFKEIHKDIKMQAYQQYIFLLAMNL